MFLESVLRFARSNCHFFALENRHFWNLFAPLVKRHTPNSEKVFFWDTLVSMPVVFQTPTLKSAKSSELQISKIITAWSATQRAYVCSSCGKIIL